MKSLGEVKSLYKDALSSGDKLEPSIKNMGEVERFSVEKMDELKIVYAGMQNPRILNVFRELRTQLVHEHDKKNFVCMVTSICTGGGASYVAGNLAAAFALDKAKTSMLIDANLYSPKLDELIIGDATNGITDYLSDPSLSIKDVVYATGIPRVRVIPIGDSSEGAAEHFSSEKMIDFVKEVRTRYSDRFVFIDSPPVTESSEARILAELVDVVVLVVPHASVTQEQIEMAIDTVGEKKLAGLIYNN